MVAPSEPLREGNLRSGSGRNSLRNLSPERWPAFLTRTHLKSILSCSSRTVSRLLADELPSIRLRGTRYVRREALLKFLADREREPTPTGPRPRQPAVVPRRGRVRRRGRK